MCGGCWVKYGSPQVDTPGVRQMAELVNALYEVEPSGGMLHVQLDDWNIEDNFWEEPFQDYLLELHGRQPLAAEEIIAETFKGMALEERASALALADRMWK